MAIASRLDYEQILRYDFVSFIERSFSELNPQTPYLPSQHLEVIASRLEGCRLGRVRRLIITLPPRSLKSHCVSVAFPAYLFGHNPSAQVICASYGQDLADKLARDCRTLMASSFYGRLFPNTVLSADKQAVNDFITTQQGFRMATSVGGVLTGRGADFIILDDPIKPEDAYSETRRASVKSWYDNTLLSRLNSKDTGVIILVMQRLHQDDLVAHALEHGNWEVLSFPAIATQDETHHYETVFGRQVFTRKTGEPLQPNREGLETLERIRREIGEYTFLSQYQQEPVPPGGAIIKTAWLTYYDTLPDRFGMIVQSWDTANKCGELNDYSVCTTWGVARQRYFLLDVYRRRLNFPELKRALKEQATRHQPHAIVIEDKASGTQLIQELKSEGIVGIRPYEPPSSTDKVMRLVAQSASFESGCVLLPRSASWLTDYVNELTSFPGSKFDDQVDSTTQALEYIKSKGSLLVWERL